MDHQQYEVDNQEERTSCSGYCHGCQITFKVLWTKGGTERTHMAAKGTVVEFRIVGKSTFDAPERWEVSPMLDNSELRSGVRAASLQDSENTGNKAGAVADLCATTEGAKNL